MLPGSSFGNMMGFSLFMGVISPSKFSLLVVERLHPLMMVLFLGQRALLLA